jgi:glycerate kinase
MSCSIFPGPLKNVHAVKLLELDKRILQTELIVLCDVENTLLGEHGAAKIFGPQKGATNDDCKTFGRWI